MSPATPSFLKPLCWVSPRVQCASGLCVVLYIKWTMVWTVLILGFAVGFNNAYVLPARRRSQSAVLLQLSQKVNERIREDAKQQLTQLLSAAPRNEATSRRETEEILRVVRELEGMCPTPDDKVLESLGGNWELLWTAQDDTSREWKMGPLRSWINPLENQAYSNNPDGTVSEGSTKGRSNPVLPRTVQDNLEKMGIIVPEAATDGVRSSQSIDLKRGRVRNVVAFSIPSFGKSRRASLTVDVGFRPNTIDARRVDVKFNSCRLVISDSPVDVTFPLGLIGPTGWLRTGFIDENTRITRGHKGSVFLLSRTSTKTS